MKTHSALLVFVLMVTARSAAFAEDAFDRDLQAAKKMWTITLAIHYYYDNHLMFPEAYSYDKAAGKPLLSWRVHLLPFIGHEELYKKFKLNEPWDSEHNKSLIAEMPSLYAAPGGANRQEGKTCYLTIRGAGSAFPPEKRIGLRDIKDGTSNTIMIVETNEAAAITWSKPEDYLLSDKPFDGLRRDGAAGYIVIMCDGAVYRISDQIDGDLFRALSNRDDGTPRMLDEWSKFAEPLRTRDIKLVDVP